MKIQQYTHPQLTSNTYKITAAKSNQVWLFDLGAFDQVLSKLNPNQKINGAFLTHPHYDHIAGIAQLVKAFPECKIYGSAITLQALSDPKQNLSFYHEDPVVYTGQNLYNLTEGNQVQLWEGFIVTAYTTPGHNPGCMTFKIGDYLFTGDSYIPNLDVVTKLPLGNKTQSIESLKKISALLLPNTTICPGHGPMAITHEVIPHLTKLITPPASSNI